MNRDFSLDEFRQYILNTPDESTITLFKVPYTQAESILTNYVASVENVNFGLTRHKLFTLSNGMILFEKTLDRSYYFLFPDRSEYGKFFSGNLYWSVSVHFDNSGNVYSSFTLKSDKTSSLVRRSIKNTSSYAIKGENLHYTLYYLPNGNVCYLTPRINDWYDGYWFDNYNEFEFVFKNIFNP